MQRNTKSYSINKFPTNSGKDYDILTNLVKLKLP